MPEVDPNSSVNLDGLSDFELRQFETPARSSRHRTEAFVPALPMAVLVAVVEAGSEKALPVILAIHRQLKMTRREWTPINAAVWKAAGDPSAKKRAAIMRKLKRLPAFLRVELHRTPSSHYRAGKGPQWARI